ncbi:MAG: D-alanyl-D-alanine carboxypeptidase, partial [Lachnospiraceae bacterium]|nr:D-alanyl-D-alanine carboxypeptidase [Lachnospiraceae bacterium]
TYTLPATNMHEARAFNTHLALVVPTAPEYYADCIGGKTGVTTVALNTLATAAQRDGKTLIAITLRADPGQVCADTTA